MTFKADQRFLVFDYETKDRKSLKLVGGWEYSLTADVMCVGWRLGTRAELPNVATKVWSPKFPSPYGELVKALCDPSVICVAHNAFFEQVITRNSLSRIINRPELKTIPPERFICTATLAAALALPRALENALPAMGLAHRKDAEGHRLMLKMSKPRKPTKNNPAIWHDSEEDYRRLMAYCAADVDAETELFLACPSLSGYERMTWCLDQRINLRGFVADRELIKTALRLTDLEVARFDKEVTRITGGAATSVNQRDALLAWLKDNDCHMPNLRANTVHEYLTEGLATGDARTLLEARQAGAKSSTKKYRAFDLRSRSDGRVRDILLYWGASTGRFSGRGVQIQNLPRPTIRNTDLAAEIVKTGDLGTIRAIYGNPLDTFSSCLRSVIIPPEGTEFFCGDYAGIEARVLFWLAGHEQGLKAFREGQDLYKQMAAVIYNINHLENVTKEQRDLGKRVILGCGYGMGATKFRETCRVQYGLEVSEELAERAVKAYRRTHYPVVKLWNNLERAAIFAVQNPGKRVKVNRTAWFVRGKFLWCALPSGRLLAFADPEVKYEKTKWGDKRPRLSYMSWNPKVKGNKWVRQYNWGGGLTENVDQGTARDLMVDAMHREEDAGYRIDITVHDELLTNRKKGEGSCAEFERLMAEGSAWAEGLPVKVESYRANRYRK